MAAAVKQKIHVEGEAAWNLDFQCFVIMLLWKAGYRDGVSLYFSPKSLPVMTPPSPALIAVLSYAWEVYQR